MRPSAAQPRRIACVRTHPPHSLHTHTRLPHYPSVAQSWCADEIKIDRNASGGLGIRTHFPDDDVTDVAEKCSWDKYCAGTQRQGSDPEHAASRREDSPSQWFAPSLTVV